MQHTFILALVFAFAAVCVTSYPTHGYKRGVVAGGISCADLELLAPAVSWIYDYTHDPSADIADCAHNLGVEFVPMQKGSGTIGSLGGDLPSDTRNILGFNEPNSAGQSDLSPEDAASLWMNQVIPQLRQANYRGRIGTPSPILGRTPGPAEWFTRFFAACTDCHFDFMATHFYGDDVPHLQAYVQSLNNKFNLPIWVTEIARAFSHEPVEESFMRSTIAWMERTQYIERYAWFSARNNGGTFPGVDTTLLQHRATALTSLGHLYISLPFQVPDSATVTSSTVAISVTTSTTAGITSSTASSKKSSTTAHAAATTGLHASSSSSKKSTSTGSVSAHAAATKNSASTSKASVSTSHVAHSSSSTIGKATTIHAASSSTSAHKASTLSHA